MADAATATPPAASAAPPSSPGVTGDPISDKILGIEAQNVTTARAALKGSQEKEERRLAGIEGSVEGLKPPTFSPPPMPQVHQTSPQQAWGSAAMIFSLIASAFTRRHLTTAMNSAASALEAFRKGDVENANAAFNQWKILSDQAMKQADFEMQRYTAIMGDAERREKLVTSLGEQEQTNTLAELKATGQALGDELMAHVQSVHEADQLLIERMRLSEMMHLQSEKVSESFYFTQGMKKWGDEFQQKNGRPPTPEEQIAHAGQLRQSLNHQWDNQEVETAIQRSNQRASQYAKNLGYTGASANLDKILAMDLSRPPDKGEVIRQAQALDSFVQTINGNRAIRGFQLQLLQKDSGLYNRFQHYMQQFGQGGPVTRDMIATMQQLATDYMHIATLNYGDFITRQQWQHHKLGLDATEFVPPDYNPALDRKRSQYPAAPPAAIAYLKEHDTMDDWSHFDELFGQGAAAQAFAGTGEPE